MPTNIFKYLQRKHRSSIRVPTMKENLFECHILERKKGYNLSTDSLWETVQVAGLKSPHQKHLPSKENWIENFFYATVSSICL